MFKYIPLQEIFHMQSQGTTAIKNLMSKLREQYKEQKTFGLTVSYACSGEQDPFKESLNQLLRINCNAVHLCDAFYRFPNPLTAEKIIGLATELENEFNKYGDDMFTEGYSDEGTTKVCFLISIGDQLEIKELIDHPLRKTKKGR